MCSSRRHSRAQCGAASASGRGKCHGLPGAKASGGTTGEWGRRKVFNQKVLLFFSAEGGSGHVRPPMRWCPSHWVEDSLLPRAAPPVCPRRPAALAAPRRTAPLSSRALRGVFWHVSAGRKRQEAGLPCLRPRACGRARRAGRSSERVFELAAREEPAWLVARREPTQHALGFLYSLAKLSGKAYRARAGCLGRDGALNSTMKEFREQGNVVGFG